MWLFRIVAANISLSIASSVMAQDQPPALSHRLTRFEIGGGAAMLVGADGTVPCPALHARLNLVRGIGIEAVTCFRTESEALIGAYLLQAHHNLPTRYRMTPFLTYGLFGGFGYDRVSEYRYELDTLETVVTPAHTERYVSRPLGTAGGGGVRVRLASRAFLETSAQVWVSDENVFVNVFGGVSIPLGHGR